MYDLVVIGGGINGVGIAADAAGRGLTVLLCEKGDLASGTSSASTKLIHGGLRYLEHYEFALVRKALKERDLLYHNACHVIEPMRFVVPFVEGMRSKWMMRLGMFLYDRLYWHNSLPRSQVVDLAQHEYGLALAKRAVPGFIYSDCWTDDARLVVLNAIAAREQGAKILTGVECVGAERFAEHWLVRFNLGDPVQARCLVNAAGPWLDNVLQNKLMLSNKAKLSLVKGSHLVLPKLYDGQQAYLLQSDDERVVFVIPFENDYTLVGTTECVYRGVPDKLNMSHEEQAYLLGIVRSHFGADYQASDIVFSYAGCRPLSGGDDEDLGAKSRDYQLQLDKQSGKAPLLNVIGGKLTTYRLLAEQAVDKLADLFPQLTSSRTASSLLPGALALSEFKQYKKTFKQHYAWLPSSLQDRYLKSYGTLCEKFLAGKTSLEGLGKDFGHGLYQAEVDYLVAEQWAKQAMDILWRRTKLILRFTELEKKKLTDYLQTVVRF